MITTNRQPCKLATGLQVWLVLFTQSGCTLANTKITYDKVVPAVKYWPHNLFYNQSRRIL